jgi:selenide,water dikinase
MLARFPDLLVGRESADDAAVWRLNDSQAIVATTDFFMPIVDDPYDFGRIAAANALSDVYAMGGRPFMALALVAMPLARLGPDTVRRVLAGGEAMCAEAGIPVAGGHSIDSIEPIYGLVVLGLVHPDRVLRNDRAREGDVLVLGKPLGVGILGAALKKGLLSREGYAAMVATATTLNTVGASLADDPDVHAMTDVTGFGLLGHALEMARGSGLVAVLEQARVPRLAEATEHARAGVVTGASRRNWESYGDAVRLPVGLEEAERHLLTDPQTSGGLLVACAPQAADRVVTAMRAAGLPAATRVGRLRAGGTPGVEVVQG